MERQILHVDVNSAFLSWSAVYMLKNGSKEDIRNMTAVIGGDEKTRTGIVLAKSEKAKECGVKTGESLYMARKKCRALRVYPTNFKVYKYYSNELYKLLLEYTDKIERFSIDECFLDITEYLMGRTPLDIANEISKRVRDTLGFTVNIGVAHNKLLAKMASDFTKPNRVHTLYKEEIERKMWPLPVSELFMLGGKTVPKLNNMQIKTIGDLAKTDKDRIIKKFGKHGLKMWEYANGIDNSPVINKVPVPKSIGNSVTLPKDIVGDEIYAVLLSLTDKVMYRLRKYNLQAKEICIELKTKDFFIYSHQKSLVVPTSNTREVYNMVKHIFNEIYKGDYIRLVGVRVDKLVSKEEEQLSIFSEEKIKNENLDIVIDNLKDRFGYKSITIAGKLDKSSGNILEHM